MVSSIITVDSVAYAANLRQQAIDALDQAIARPNGASVNWQVIYKFWYKCASMEDAMLEDNYHLISTMYPLNKQEIEATWAKLRQQHDYFWQGVIQATYPHCTLPKTIEVEF